MCVIIYNSVIDGNQMYFKGDSGRFEIETTYNPTFTSPVGVDYKYEAFKPSSFTSYVKPANSFTVNHFEIKDFTPITYTNTFTAPVSYSTSWNNNYFASGSLWFNN